MIAPQYFKPGDVVAYRGVWRGKVMWSCAARVVVDRTDLSALYWQAGSPVVRPAVRPTPKNLLENEFTLISDEWKKTDVLSLTQPGAEHSVELKWLTGTDNLDCWYVNLQEPLRRSIIGFDTMDQLLDIVISPDKKEWRWKDEDEFAEAEALGVFSHAEAALIRAEGEEVIKLLDNNQPPFFDGWETWAPPVEWGIPDLPTGWDQVTEGDGNRGQSTG